MRQPALSLIALTVALASPGFSQDPAVTIGVLEWSKCSPQAPETVSARLLFQQQGAQWIALTDPQDSQDHARQSWVLAFDGRNLGSVVGASPRSPSIVFGEMAKTNALTMR